MADLNPKTRTMEQANTLYPMLDPSSHRLPGKYILEVQKQTKTNNNNSATPEYTATVSCDYSNYNVLEKIIHHICEFFRSRSIDKDRQKKIEEDFNTRLNDKNNVCDDEINHIKTHFQKEGVEKIRICNIGVKPQEISLSDEKKDGKTDFSQNMPIEEKILSNSSHKKESFTQKETIKNNQPNNVISSLNQAGKNERRGLDPEIINKVVDKHKDLFFLNNSSKLTQPVIVISLDLDETIVHSIESPYSLETIRSLRKNGYVEYVNIFDRNEISCFIEAQIKNGSIMYLTTDKDKDDEVNDLMEASVFVKINTGMINFIKELIQEAKNNDSTLEIHVRTHGYYSEKFINSIFKKQGINKIDYIYNRRCQDFYENQDQINEAKIHDLKNNFSEKEERQGILSIDDNREVCARMQENNFPYLLAKPFRG